MPSRRQSSWLCSARELRRILALTMELLSLWCAAFSLHEPYSANLSLNRLGTICRKRKFLNAALEILKLGLRNALPTALHDCAGSLRHPVAELRGARLLLRDDLA